MPEQDLINQIEKLFAEVNKENLRLTTRQLEQTVRKLEDRQLRKRYESAIDHLPDMVDHVDLG